MSELKEAFIKTYGQVKDLQAVKSLLRICPIGAHSDYQSGRVTGMTLNAAVDMVYSPREDNFVQIQSKDFPDRNFFRMDMIQNIFQDSGDHIFVVP